MTVASPSTWNSSSARRARASASCAVGAVHDQLGQHRVELAADHRAGLDTGVQPHAGAGRRVELGHRAGGGQEAAAGVLAVDPELEGVAARRGILGQVQLLAVGDAELLAHQVDARGLLGDRVLDLQTGVDLEERDQPVLADQVFDGARRRSSAPPCRSAWPTRGSPCAARRSRTAPAPLPPVSGSGAAASSRGCPRRRRCRAGRRSPAPRRGGACPGSARRSTHRGRTRPWPRAPPTRTARGSPRWCGRPSCPCRHRRRRP